MAELGGQHHALAPRAADAGEAEGLTLDGEALPGNTLPLRDEHLEHVIDVRVN